jgi:Protein of unknown function (DUF2865)
MGRFAVAVRWKLGALALGIATIGALPATAQAEDFFSALFGGLSAPQREAPQPYVRLPFADEAAPRPRPAPRSAVSYSGGGGGQAWCVRTCDGRYFPLAATGDLGKAAACNNFCPASKTEVVYGSAIDDAATDSGKPYSQLPNAFRYRTEIVDGCTCNGKDQFGLAKVPIESDATLRKGDLVASADGLMVANRTAGRHAELNFSPAPGALNEKFRRAPVLASE